MHVLGVINKVVGIVRCFEGVVVRGRSLGRSLGFPTANVELSSDVDVESGVYLSTIYLDGASYNGVTNIGTNPTVGEVSRRGESYIFDFDGDIYDKLIGVELRDHLRGEIRFDSVEALRAQILKDVEQAREMISAAENK